MPIIVDSEICVFSQERFHELAEKAIGIVFDVHNQFGRLLHEEAYKRIIQSRWEQAGMGPARREVEILVRHGTFEKKYFIDLLFALGLMIEAKTVETLTSSHEAQTLHYLMLTDMHHGLLINLRPARVEKRFISTSLNIAQRREFTITDSQWNPVNEASERLRTHLIDLLDDWGAFLAVSLYRDAILHFFGGSAAALSPVPIYDQNQAVGTHPFCLLADDTALAITGLKTDQARMQEHLQRLQSHTQLRCIQWINMHNHSIELRTLLQ